MSADPKVIGLLRDAATKLREANALLNDAWSIAPQPLVWRLDHIYTHVAEDEWPDAIEKLAGDLEAVL